RAAARLLVGEDDVQGVVAVGEHGGVDLDRLTDDALDLPGPAVDARLDVSDDEPRGRARRGGGCRRDARHGLFLAASLPEPASRAASPALRRSGVQIRCGTVPPPGLR